jgi:prepilin-type N-terminal cleavage/methylation domain-containing protein
MKKGFTLVELLIVIIIIGILVTMAMPQYQKMVNRARWAEAMQLAGSVKTAETLYYAENNAFTAADANLTVLNTLDLPLVANRQFTFSIKTANRVYAVSKSREAADDFAITGTWPYFCINLSNNTTEFGGTVPGGAAPGNL